MLFLDEIINVLFLAPSVRSYKFLLALFIELMSKYFGKILQTERMNKLFSRNQNLIFIKFCNTK